MGDVFSSQITPKWMKLASRTVKVGTGQQAHHAIVLGAADYSGIGVKRIRQLVLDGFVIGGPDPESGRGDLIVDRDSLDAYRAGQLGVSTVAAEIHRLGEMGAG